MACNLDETWVDCLAEFKETLEKAGATWRCYTCEGTDKEAMLSAPEVMDAKTDPGCGYGTVRSLNALLKDGVIPSAQTLQGQALLDVMDLIHVKELQYFQGFSFSAGCLAFSYFLRMDLLEKQNSTLYAYCRGVARCVQLTLRAVMTTRVRSDEEFVPWIKELEQEESVSEEEIIRGLERAESAAESPAVAARLRWRRLFLSALTAFVLPSNRSEKETACDMCLDACELLDSDEFQRQAEPVQDGNFFREKEVVYWASSLTPTKPLPCAPFAEAMQAYKTMLGQLASLKNMFDVPSLQVLMEFVEALGARKPLLPIRSIAVIFLLCHDPSESFLYGPPLPHRILVELANEHGAPLYLKVFEGDEGVVEGVVKYRIHRTMDPLKITPDQPVFLRHQTVEAVRHWAREMSKVYLTHLESMLCNRGLAHRRLMNALPQLRLLQEVAYSTDTSVFLSHVPSVSSELEAEAIKRMPILSMYANQHILHVMHVLFSLTLELNLFTQGEFVPALWYLNFTQRAQIENLTMLVPLPASMIPETRINRRTKVPLYNLALTTRTVGNADSVRVVILEAGRMIADAVFVSACVMESKGLIDLTSAPKHSLMTVENAFNHRMKCLQHIHSPPFTPYARCMAAKPDMSGVLDSGTSKVLFYAQKAGEIAVNAAERLKQLMASREMNAIRKMALQTHVEAMERTARAVGASLAVFAAVCDNEEALRGYTVTPECSFHPSMLFFALRKKETR